MRKLLLMLLLGSMSLSTAQENQKITTIDFVQVLNDHKKEVMYYYTNNWKVLREMALKKKYIYDYQLLETPYSDDAPFQFMLITTYPNTRAYEQRETHFDELIAERGAVRLLNQKKPEAFRKILFNKTAYHRHN